MFWKKSDDDPDSAWKEQHDAIATNPLYSFINVKKHGTLINVYNATWENEGTWALEQYIKRELEPFFYRQGKGQIITEKDFKAFKLEKMRKKHPNLTAADINIFDDDFNKFTCHEACWDLRKRGAVGETALHLCTLGNTEIHLVIARVLLKLYPKLALDFYEADEYYGESALHIAIVNGDFEMVKILVENGADVNLRATGRFFLPEDQKAGKTKNTTYQGYAYYGEYPLAFAACFGHEEIYDYLMEHGARPNYQDSFGNTVLHMMVIANQITMLGYAVKHHNHKANMEVTNNSNLTPLTLASKLGRNDIFKEFIELQRFEIWRYSNITCSTYPLAAIDTIGPNGKTNFSAALIYITEGETEDHLDMLAGGVLKQLLYSKWKTFARRRFFERLVLAVLHLLVLSIAIYTRPGDQTKLLGDWSLIATVRYIAEIIVCIACLINLLSQLDEVRSQGLLAFIKNQSSAPAKVIFNVSCILILLCVPMRFLGQTDIEMVLLALAAPCAWIFLLFFARGIPLTGPFVIMIYKMLAADMVRFVTIFVIFLAQFSQGFFFLFKDIDNKNINSFRTIGSTIMQLFQMTLGEFKYEDFAETRIPILTKAVFAVFAILVPILLLNMLIAMMGNTYQMIISRSEKEWKRQWAKIIIVLERTFSPKQLKMYQDIYSSELPESDARGLIVIKTSRKTKARQRKGAISNWKKLVNEIKALIKEQRRQGYKGPLDLTSEEVSEHLTERHLRKRRSTIPTQMGLDESGMGAQDGMSDGLLSAMTQLAWEKDIDLTKGKAFSDAPGVIQEEAEPEAPPPAATAPPARGASPAGRNSCSPGDTTPLLKENTHHQSSSHVRSGMGVAKTPAASTATPNNYGTNPPTIPANNNKPGKANKPLSNPKTDRPSSNPKTDRPSSNPKTDRPSSNPKTDRPSSNPKHTAKVHPDGGRAKESRQGSAASREDDSRRSSASGSVSGGSKESKDSAFVSETLSTEPRSGRVTRLAISTSRSSLNSASSLTSLLHAWDSKDKEEKQRDATEF